MSIARRVRITGRVQGVFFRAWTGRQADRLDVNGWVRNCSDGSVEALLEGREEAVEQLIQLLKRGPSGARVEKVEVAEAEAEHHDWFTVRH
jgi:acylphosphatase